MGLFNFNFGSSKKDKPIRDKIKNRKYFNELLKELSKDKDETERLIPEANNNKRIDKVFLYWTLGQNSIYEIEIRYSMDANRKELMRAYSGSLEYFIAGCEIKDPIYFEILKRISLGVLLNISSNEFHQLVDYVKRVDNQAKPADWTPDLLLWFMLNSRLKGDEKQTYADKLAFPKLYKGLFKLTQISDAQEAKKALNDYIEKWYNLNKDAPWYNNHLKKNCYRGYWAWEVAAVAKIMHIDDSDLKDNPYYPYDMVHWEDAGTTTEEQPI
ncbi:PoNe immunity protein domain-containing protein [Prevotella fusca]